jgi:hypothetical protein
VHDALHAIGRDVALADDRGERRQKRLAGERGRDGHLVERRHADRFRRVQVEADGVLHEVGEPRLVLPVEPDALVAPAPPLHVLDVGHFFFFRSDRSG